MYARAKAIVGKRVVRIDVLIRVRLWIDRNHAGDVKASLKEQQIMGCCALGKTGVRITNESSIDADKKMP